MDLSEQSPTARPHFDSAELRTPPDSAARDLEARLGDAIEVTRDWLLKRQHPDGHWCAELEGDTILESEYILLLAWLGQEQSPIARKCASFRASTIAMTRPADFSRANASRMVGAPLSTSS